MKNVAEINKFTLRKVLEGILVAISAGALLLVIASDLKWINFSSSNDLFWITIFVNLFILPTLDYFDKKKGESK